MRNNGVGGMRTAGIQYSVICQKWGRPSARKDITQTGFKYLHFTKKGSVWHGVNSDQEAAGVEVTKNGLKSC